MLSPYMSKTFLSILSVPNKTDFCTIPTFNLIPSMSIHPLKPLVMHPKAPTTTVQPQPFSATKAFSALPSNSDIFQYFRFFFFFSRILQSPGIATSMMTHDFAFLSTKIKSDLLASITITLDIYIPD